MRNGILPKYELVLGLKFSNFRSIVEISLLIRVLIQCTCNEMVTDFFAPQIFLNQLIIVFLLR